MKDQTLVLFRLKIPSKNIKHDNFNIIEFLQKTYLYMMSLINVVIVILRSCNTYVMICFFVLEGDGIKQTAERCSDKKIWSSRLELSETFFEFKPRQKIQIAANCLRIRTRSSHIARSSSDIISRSRTLKPQPHRHLKFLAVCKFHVALFSLFGALSARGFAPNRKYATALTLDFQRIHRKCRTPQSMNHDFFSFVFFCFFTDKTLGTNYKRRNCQGLRRKRDKRLSDKYWLNQQSQKEC